MNGTDGRAFGQDKAGVTITSGRTARLWYALAIAAIALLGFASCFTPAQSVAPLYTEKDLMLDDTIVGSWHSGKERNNEINGIGEEWTPSSDCYVIEKSTDWKDRGYIVQRGDGDTSELHLLRLGKYLFVDVGAWWDSAASEWVPFSPDLPPVYPYSFFPVHEFGRLTVSPKVLLVRMIEGDKVLRLYREHKLHMEWTDPPYLIVSSTEELQKFAVERAEDLKVFPKNFALCRQSADCGLEVPLEEVKDDPQDAGAGYDLASAYMHRDRFDDAWTTWKHTPPPKPGPAGEPQSDFLHALPLAVSFIEWGHPSNGLEVLKTGTANRPKDPVAWMTLGLGYLHLYQPQDAMAASQKIRPTMFPIKQRTDAEDIAHFLYALAYMQMAEFEKARAETAKSNGVFARDGVQLLSHFAEGNYAAVDALLTRNKFYAEGHEALLWYLTLRHLGKSQAALELLNKVENRETSVLLDPGIFPAETLKIKQLASYFRAQISDADFIAQIHPAKGRVVVPELCAAYFIVGEKHLLDGDRNQAREYFQKAVDTHAYIYAEWIVARARLKQMAGPAFTAATVPSSSTTATQR